MLDILYYYYYLFYTKVLPDNSPHFTVVWVLSFVLSIIVVGILHLFLVLFFKIPFKKEYIVLFLATFAMMYFRYLKSGRGEIVVEQKPMLKGSNKLSMIFTVGVTVMALIVMFLFPLLTRFILLGY